MSYASSRAWALKETFRGFRQNFSLFSLATFLSALALSIPLFISTIFYELAEPIRQIPTSVEITVFTKSGTDMEKLSKAVAEIETIERVSLVPKDEAIRSLNEHLGLKDKAVKHNPLPDILIATVSSSNVYLLQIKHLFCRNCRCHLTGTVRIVSCYSRTGRCCRRLYRFACRSRCRCRRCP